MIIPEYKDPQYCYRAKVVNIVDGDTIDVDMDLGCNIHVFKRLRLLGIDTWEVRGKEREHGLIAKQFVIDKLAEVDNNVMVQTKMDSEGKYGRLLAWVWTKPNETPVCLNEELLNEGHGTETNY